MYSTYTILNYTFSKYLTLGSGLDENSRYTNVISEYTCCEHKDLCIRYKGVYTEHPIDQLIRLNH